MGYVSFTECKHKLFRFPGLTVLCREVAHEDDRHEVTRAGLKWISSPFIDFNQLMANLPIGSMGRKVYIPANSNIPSVPWILWAKKTLGDSISQMLKWDDGIFTYYMNGFDLGKMCR